jgi:hypothetical protein
MNRTIKHNVASGSPKTGKPSRPQSATNTQVERASEATSSMDKDVRKPSPKHGQQQPALKAPGKDRLSPPAQAADSRQGGKKS